MCVCCVCCVSSKFCTFLTSVLTGIESFLFACLNMTLILGYTCKIQPPSKDHLAAGFQFIEQCWSWFFYDEENCERKHGPDYERPLWIIDVPSYFSDSKVVDAVSPYANYCYQIIYFILHALWFFSVFLLFYGNSKKRWVYFLPWIVVGIMLTFMDTLTGAFYIKLMDDTHPGWEDGRAIFSMQFLHFRTFFIYILNIIAIIFVILTCISVYKKRRRMEKLVRKLSPDKTEVVVKKTILMSVPRSRDASTSSSSQEQVFVSAQAQVNTREKLHQNPNEEPHLTSRQSTDPIRNPVPARYRPFSYMNPTYRPTDPHDLEGMKIHAAGLPMKGDDYCTFDTAINSDPVQEIDRIPRASLKK